jgi:hypothetical protein
MEHVQESALNREATISILETVQKESGRLKINGCFKKTIRINIKEL